MSYHKRNFYRYFILLISMLCALLLFSCKPEPTVPEEPPKIIIKGTLDYPAGISVTDDIWISIYDDGVLLRTDTASGDGTFSVSGLAPKEYSLVFSTVKPSAGSLSRDITPRSSETKGYGGWLGNIVAVPEPEAVPQIVEMKALGTIKGKVVYSTAKEDGSNYDINAYIPGTGYIAFTDKDGSFTIFNVPQGKYDLRFTSSGYIAETRKDNVLSSESRSVNPVLDIGTVSLKLNAASLSGKVSVEDPAKLAGITVRLEGKDSVTDLYTETSNDGAWRITGILPGTYKVIYHAEGYSDMQKEVSLSPEDDIDLGLSEPLVRKTGSVKGSFILEKDANAGGIIVQLSSIDGSYAKSVETDAEGNYSFTGIESGLYRIIAAKADYLSITVKDVRVAANTETTVPENTLNYSRSSLKGSAVLVAADDSCGILVTATNMADSSRVYTALTNGKGEFSFNGMVPGIYEINYSLPGYVSREFSNITVSGNDPNTLEKVTLEMEKGRIEGNAYITLPGSGNGGIKVELLDNGMTTETDEYGHYSFSVPFGNYYRGIRFSYDKYGTKTHVANLPVLNDRKPVIVPDQVLDLRFIRITGKVESPDLSATTMLFNGQSVAIGKDGNFVVEDAEAGECRIEISAPGCPGVNEVRNLKKSTDLGTFTMSQGSSAVYGSLSMEGKFYLDGINIELKEVTTGKSYSTVTPRNGNFRIANIPAGTYEASFSKEGWKSVTVNGINLSAGEEKDITSLLSPLRDTEAPVIKSFTVNGGSDRLEGNTVEVFIDASDLGSGLSTIRVEWQGSESSELWNFSDSMELSVKPEGFGAKVLSVYVIDKSGNESAPKTSQVMVRKATGATIMDGTLKGDALNWTSAGNPYVIESDLVVEKGDTLRIGKGVRCYVNGSYRINSRGTVIIEGTADEPAVFSISGNELDRYGMTGYTGEWGGIALSSDTSDIADNGSYISGNRIVNAVFKDMYQGITGACYIKDSVLMSSLDAIGNPSVPFTGMVSGSEITGKVNIEAGRNSVSMIVGSDLRAPYTSNTGDVTLILNDSCLYDSSVYNHGLSTAGTRTRLEADIFQNITTGSIDAHTVIENSVFENLLAPLSFSGKGDLSMHGCNFSDCILPVLIHFDGDINADFRMNWWGETNNAAIGSSKTEDLPFMEWSAASRKVPAYVMPHLPSPSSTAGPVGDAFAFATVMIPFRPKVGDTFFVRISAAESDVARYRLAFGSNELPSAEWKDYDGYAAVYPDEIDMKALTPQGDIPVFIDAETADGSRILPHLLYVPYSAPVVKMFPVESGKKYQGGEIVLSENTAFSSSAEEIEMKWFVDGTLLQGDVLVLSSLSNGDHTLRLEATDRAGNMTEEERTFSIGLPVSDVKMEVLSDLPLRENTDLELSFTFDGKSVREFTLMSEERKLFTVKVGENERTVKRTVHHEMLVPGNMELHLFVTDRNGNSEEKSGTSITVEGQAAVVPVITVCDLPATLTEYRDYTVTSTIRDTRGIRNVTITDNGEVIRSINYDDFVPEREIRATFDIPASSRRDGTYEYVIHAENFAGLSTDRTVTYTISKKLPVFTLISAESGGTRFSVEGMEHLDATRNEESYCQLYTVVNGVVYPTLQYFSIPKGNNEITLIRPSVEAGDNKVSYIFVDTAGNPVMTPSFTFTKENLWGSWGRGVDWNERGSFLVNSGETVFLMGFEDASRPWLESVSGRELVISSGNRVLDGVGNGAASGLSFETVLESNLPFTNDFQVSFWVKRGSGAEGEIDMSPLFKYDAATDSFIFGTGYGTAGEPGSDQCNGRAGGNIDYGDGWMLYQVGSHYGNMYLRRNGVTVSELTLPEDARKIDRVRISGNDSFSIDEVLISNKYFFTWALYEDACNNNGSLAGYRVVQP